jgi:choline transporter-like protein 2/4/5
MRYMAVVFIIAVIVLTLGGLGWVGWWAYDTALFKWNFAKKLGPNDTDASKYDSDGWTWMWVAIGVWGLDAILLLITLCTICQIQTAIKILGFASDFVRDHCEVILAPIITTLIFVVWMVFCGFAFLFIYSMGTITRSPTSTFSTMKWNDGEWTYLTVQVLIAMWVCSWIISYTYFIISAMTVEWYFKSQTGTPVSMGMSMKWGLLYHAGTLAFGAFLIVLVWLLRIAVKVAMNAAKKATGDNCCIKAVACYLNCCCKCLENLIQFINTHAYVEVILRSCNFCTGARQGWKVISNNAAKFGFMNTVLGLFNFILVLLVASGTTAIVHLIVAASQNKQYTQIDSRNTPIAVVVFLLSYLIGKLFMSVYAISADTIMHCFCIDHVVGKKSNMGVSHARESIKGFAAENDTEKGNSPYGNFNF